MQLITNGKTILPDIYTDASVTIDSQVFNSNETTRYIEFVGIDNNNYESYLNTVFWYKPAFTSTKNSNVSIQFVYNNSLNYNCLIRNPEMIAGNVYALAFDRDDVSGVYLKIISNAASGSSTEPIIMDAKGLTVNTNYNFGTVAMSSSDTLEALFSVSLSRNTNDTKWLALLHIKAVSNADVGVVSFAGKMIYTNENGFSSNSFVYGNPSTTSNTVLLYFIPRDSSTNIATYDNIVFNKIYENSLNGSNIIFNDDGLSETSVSGGSKAFTFTNHASFADSASKLTGNNTTINVAGFLKSTAQTLYKNNSTVTLTLQKKMINSETDINTLTTDGIYASSFGVYDLVNAPGGQSDAQFLMIVNADIGHSIMQIAFMNDKKVYMRTAGGAGDFTGINWVQVAPAQTTTWTGTLDEYNAITTKDDNTIYYIKE